MSTMISEVYDALQSAGAPEEKARAAATVLADTLAARTDLNALATKADLGAIAAKADLLAAKIDLLATKADVEAVKADLLKWVIGAIGFQTLVILGALVSLMRVAAR